jgi:hypothetical protein
MTALQTAVIAGVTVLALVVLGARELVALHRQPAAPPPALTAMSLILTLLFLAGAAWRLGVAL